MFHVKHFFSFIANVPRGTFKNQSARNDLFHVEHFTCHVEHKNVKREVNIMPIILTAYIAILALALWQDEQGTHSER